MAQGSSQLPVPTPAKPWNGIPGFVGLLVGCLLWLLIAYAQGDYGKNPARIRYRLESTAPAGNVEALQTWLEQQPQVHSARASRSGSSLVVRYTYADGADAEAINQELKLESLPIRFGFGSAEDIYVTTYSPKQREIAHVFPFYRLDNWLGGIGFFACLFVAALAGALIGRKFLH
jgi:hypothetical protein